MVALLSVSLTYSVIVVHLPLRRLTSTSRSVPWTVCSFLVAASASLVTILTKRGWRHLSTVILLMIFSLTWLMCRSLVCWVVCNRLTTKLLMSWVFFCFCSYVLYIFLLVTLCSSSLPFWHFNRNGRIAVFVPPSFSLYQIRNRPHRFFSGLWVRRKFLFGYGMEN